MKADTLPDAVPTVLVGVDVVRDVVLGAVILGVPDVVYFTPPGSGAAPAASEFAAARSASVVVGVRAELGDDAAAGAVTPVGLGATVGGGGVEIARTEAPSR